MNELRCPACGSQNAECDGKMHTCLDCGYDGRTPPEEYGRDALIEKLADAVSVSADFFNARDEMNAAVHTPSPMRLSPITVMVNEALESWRRWKFPLASDSEQVAEETPSESPHSGGPASH